MSSTVDYLRAMFDELLPVPSIVEKAAIVRRTADLELHTETETHALHLYWRHSPRARAGSHRVEDFGRNGQAGVR